MTIGLLIMVLIAFVFSWLIAFGPLYDDMAYPGDLQPQEIPALKGYYLVLDCLHSRMFFNGKVVPMSDGEIDRMCSK